MAAGQDPPREAILQTPPPNLGGADGLVAQANLPVVQELPPAIQPSAPRKSSGDPLRDLENRAADAATPAEALEWARARRDISQQRQEESKLQQTELESKRQFWGGVTRACVSMGTIASGTVLMLNGHPQVGVYVIGAGIAGTNPKYFIDYFRRLMMGGR